MEPIQPTYQFGTAVFIGRFQPFHNGHMKVIQAALAEAERLIICVGGAHAARRPRNPWTFEERVGMIRGSLSAYTNERVVIVPIPDHTYNETAWLEAVQAQVAYHKMRDKPGIALAGRYKDRSSYYLRLFPQWGEIKVESKCVLDATTLRRGLFLKSELPENVPVNVRDYLQTYMASPEARRMRAEWAFVEKYKATHDNGEYHRNNVCSDAIVVQAGHVLLVRRKALPGKGMLALPGGHVERDETALDAAMRELREETGLKVPDAVLLGSIEKHRVFDDPYRSDLCRTYSHSYYVVLKNEGNKLAKIRAGSDAESVQWVPLSEVYPEELFDDHYHIIRYFTGTGIDRV